MQRRLLPLILASTSLVAMTGCAGIDHQSNRELSQARSDKLQPKVMLQGKEIKGTTLTTFDQQGRSLTLKIADVELDPNDSDRETYLYTVQHQNLTTSQWQNLCQPDKEGVAKAIALSGQWDKTGAHLDNGQITFACTNGVLAKCVRWGYKPWKTVNGQSLRDYHQACTRMARADYCGTGISHTQEGTPIDVYDRLKIQQPTPKSSMMFEAAWSPEGAVLLNRTRYPDTLAQLQQECPEKLQAMLQPESQVVLAKPFHSRSSDPGVSSIAANSDQQVPEALIFNRSFPSSGRQGLIH